MSIEIRNVFTSTVFPDAEDMKVWDNMSDAEKIAEIKASEQDGFESGIAPNETLHARLARVRDQ